MRGVVASLATVVALAGCAAGPTGEANSYVAAVNRAQSRFTSTVGRVSGRIGATSDRRADRRVLRSFDAAVRRVVADLRRITPPGRVAALHRRLVGEMAAYGRQVRREMAPLRSVDIRRLVAAQQRLLTATDAVTARVNATIAAINRTLRS